MSKRDELIKNVEKHGMKFPSRQRFVLSYQEGKLRIFTTNNKSRIKLENEKFNSNKSLLLDGSPTALLDIKDIQNAEEYADTIASLHDKWGIGNEENEN